MFYEEVFRALNKNKVKYAVAGGVAAVMHGAVRFTVDLDIIVDMKPQNIDKLFMTFQSLGYLPRVPVTKDQFKDPKNRRAWMEKKNMKAFSFFHRNNPLNIVDLLLDNVAQFTKVKKIQLRAGGLSVPVVSLGTLKKMKRKAGRDKDLLDLELIEKIEKHTGHG